MPPRSQVKATCVVGNQYVTAVIAGQVVVVSKEDAQQGDGNVTLHSR